MNVLLVYPQYPDSFWSFKHALRFVSKKAALPPLGLITVSAMLPETWQKRLTDMNVSELQRSDIQWADYVFISAMYIQKDSVKKIIEECLKHNVKIVAGGPLFTQDHENYPEIDHLVLNEAEITMPLFLRDLNSGGPPKKIYKTAEFADMSLTPVPDYHLLSRKYYASMTIQVSRGCPFSCNFCEITSLLGRKVRTKTPDQIVKEMEKLYDLNWRGPIVIADDNFIGNKKEIKHHLLPVMKEWMQMHKYPFSFSIESSINLADDDNLMSLMVETGFESAFIGIETPDEKSLRDCNKNQNNNRDLLQSVKKIQKAGIQVSGGFIVGFDSDTSTVFQKQIDFIQQSGIVSAMVGLLNAPKNTRLYRQLESENRITIDATGNNTDLSMNFIPRMNYQELVNGYKKIIREIYTTKPYYQRIRQLLINHGPLHGNNKSRFSFPALMAFIKSMLIIGMLNKGRRNYWRLLLWTLCKRPDLMVSAVTFSIYGYHFRKVFGLRR